MATIKVTPEVRQARYFIKKVAQMNNEIIKQDKNLRGVLRYSAVADLNRALLANVRGDVKILTKKEFTKTLKEAGIKATGQEYNDMMLQLKETIESTPERLTVEGEKEFWKQTNIDRLLGMYKGRIDGNNPQFISEGELEALRQKLLKYTYSELGDLIKQVYDSGKSEDEKVDGDGNVFKVESEGKSASYYPPSYREYIDNFLKG